VDAQGELVLHTAAGVVRQRKPVLYQELDGGRRVITGGYVLTGSRQVGFEVAAHDASRPLFIGGDVPFSFVPSTAAATTVAGTFDPVHFSVSPRR